MRTHLLLAALVVALASGLVGCDHATKRLAVDKLKDKPAIGLIPGVLDLRYVENPGSGFGVDRLYPEKLRRPLLYLPALVAAPLLLGLALRRRLGWLERLSLIFLAAGAAGNLIDRAANGFVVDFIHLHYWPVFNVADLCLCAGAALMLWSAWRERPGPAPTPV